MVIVFHIDSIVCLLPNERIFFLGSYIGLIFFFRSESAEISFALLSCQYNVRLLMKDLSKEDKQWSFVVPLSKFGLLPINHVYGFYNTKAIIVLIMNDVNNYKILSEQRHVSSMLIWCSTGIITYERACSILHLN